MQFFLSGNITDSELKEVNDNLIPQNVVIDKIVNKSFGTEDVIYFLVRDLDLLNLLRDAAYLKLLQTTIKSIKNVIFKKNKTLPAIKFECKIQKNNGNAKIINIVSDINNFEENIEKLNNYLTDDIIESFDENKIIWIKFDNKEIVIKEF